VRILAFDTATRATSVALSTQGEAVLEARDDPPSGGRPGHASRLLPLIAEVLDRSGLGYADLDRIAVGVGPGTFTGLRIGVATARGLAQAAGLPLVGVSTLRSLAVHAGSAAQAGGQDAVAAILDARRKEVFAAVWRTGGETVLPPRALAPEILAGVLREMQLTLLAVGDGTVEFREVLERSGALIPEDDSELHRVTATTHLRIAEHRAPAANPDQVQPEYLRPPDATEPSPRPASGPHEH
jgi:tRNA threonylcarbamoyladenosine biosynthesis protein TsaB